MLIVLKTWIYPNQPATHWPPLIPNVSIILYKKKKMTKADSYGHTLAPYESVTNTQKKPICYG